MIREAKILTCDRCKKEKVLYKTDGVNFDEAKGWGKVIRNGEEKNLCDVCDSEFTFFMNYK